jgi:dihydrofolate reductase
VRKIISGLFISLDGVVEAPDQWHFPYFNDEMGEAVGSLVANADAVLFGRKTFEEFSKFWPSQGDEDFGGFINNVQKYVVSNTLTNPEWRNSTVISGDVMNQVRALKEQPGKNINMTGSGTLVESLLQNGLLDELHLLVHPILVGTGRKQLFVPDHPTVPLKLADSKTFSTGVLHLVYVPAQAA